MKKKKSIVLGKAIAYRDSTWVMLKNAICFNVLLDGIRVPLGDYKIILQPLPSARRGK